MHDRPRSAPEGTRPGRAGARGILEAQPEGGDRLAEEAIRTDRSAVEELVQEIDEDSGTRTDG